MNGLYGDGGPLVIVEVVLSCEWKRKRGRTSTLAHRPASRVRRLPFHAYTKRKKKNTLIEL